MKLRIAVCIASAAFATVSTLAGGAPLGTYIGREKEALITIGMRCDDVRALLGSPAANFEYRTNDGPTWTYYLVGSAPGSFVFDIDFNADCRVAAKGERFIPLG